MSAPGTTVTQLDTLPPRSNPGDSSTWFVAGVTEKGPQVATTIRSMAQFNSTFGSRQSYSVLSDALETFFKEGGSQAVVSRVVGPSPVLATKTLLDGAGSPAATLTVKAKNYGTWGNNIGVAVVAGDSGSEFKIVIYYNGVEVERSPSLAADTDAITWSASSAYVDILDAGASALDPAVASVSSLTSGTDDHGSAVDASWKAALDLFVRDMGPGQVSMPGRTAAQAALDLLAHAEANNRVALLDAPDSATVGTLTAAAAAARAGGDGRYGAMFAPWALVPGLTAGTVRTVPYSAVVAGHIARNDAVYGANVPSAGVRGVTRYAIGLSQAGWTDVDRDTLNSAGVNVSRILFNSVRTYGWRSLVSETGDPNWINFGNSRLFMSIAGQADVIAEQYVLTQIDGQGLLFGELAGDLAAMLNQAWQEGSLYGATPDEAFAINVGDQVNTPETIQAGELHAVLSVRMSPFAETVEIQITKVAINEVVV